MSTKIALAGAAGNLGPAILKALVDAGFDVIILSRAGSKSTDSLPPHANQKIVQVDYSNVQELTSALQGVDTVVSNIAAAALDVQKPLIQASVAAGVKRYLPSEFGSDLDNPQNAVLPVFEGKVATRKYIEKVAAANPSFTYTYVVNGAFLDWGLQVGFIADPKNHTATLYDGGNVRFSTTTLTSIAKAVVGVINNQESTQNRAVYVHDTATTLNEIIELAKSIDGKEWDTKLASTEEIAKASYEELSKPDADIGKALYGFLPKAAFTVVGTSDFSDRLDNKILGLTELGKDQLKDLVKTYL